MWLWCACLIKLERFSHPQFAWLIATMNNLCGHSVLLLTEQVLLVWIVLNFCGSSSLFAPSEFFLALRSEWSNASPPNEPFSLCSLVLSLHCWLDLQTSASSRLTLVCSSLRDEHFVVPLTFNTCGWPSLLSSSGINSGEPQPLQHDSVSRRAVSTRSLFSEIYDDSEDEDDDVGYADPIQDDLYVRKMGIKPQPVANISYDKFLPKFWTPEEDDHIQKIQLGSQRRPWYKKIQGFRCEGINNT